MPSGVMPDSSEENEERRRARIRLELAANYYSQGNYNYALDELRQALAMSIDRTVLTERLLGGGERPAYGWVPPGVEGTVVVTKDGKRAESRFSSDAEGPTCLTSLQLL